MLYEMRGENLVPMKGEDHPLHKLTWEKVAEIRQKWRPGCNHEAVHVCAHVKTSGSLSSLAKEYGVSKKLILNIVTNRTWRIPESEIPNYSSRIPYIAKLDIERFWEKVDTHSGPCWNWLGGTSSFGQGRFRRGRKADGMVLAYRFAWNDMMGEIPEGKLVLHKCDNPRCVNPHHLFLGTYRDNMKDMIEKGRGRPRGKSASTGGLI